MYKKITLIVFLMMLLSVNVGAQSYFCSRPNKPYCVSSYQKFRDQNEYTSCKFEVEEYLDNIREYVECLEMEREDAVSESEEVIQDFNSRAR